jgi:Glycerol-3-phosphate dehydrogenase
MANIGVIGSGTWGTALAILLYNNGNKVTLWSVISEEVELISKTRTHKSLPEIVIPDEMIITGDLETAIKDKDVLVLSVPSVFVRETSKKMAQYVTKGQKIINVAKGIEENTLMTMSDIIKENIPNADIAVLSGPSHAEEVSRSLPTTCVVGANTKDIAEYLQEIFMSPVFRVYTSPDIIGIEVGAALKNVIALAAGVADGLGFGDNVKAALITRGIAEIARLGIAMGGNAYTFAGLTGIGDLIVTCASKHSRNLRAGFLIGQGRTPDEAMKEVKMVVEGVYSTKAAVALAKKYNIEMPIIEQVNAVIFGGKNPRIAVGDLMLRDKTIENSELPWE